MTLRVGTQLPRNLDRMTPWVRKLLAELHDGAWHDFEAVIDTMAQAVPHARAFRRAEWLRGRKLPKTNGKLPPRVRNKDSATVIAVGARHLAVAAVQGRKGIQTRMEGEVRQIRDALAATPVTTKGKRYSAHCHYGALDHSPCLEAGCRCPCHTLLR